LIESDGGGHVGEASRENQGDVAWRILALDTGTSLLEKSMLTYTSGFGEVARIPRVMWVLTGPTTIVIDTSVAASGRPAEFIGEDFSRTPEQEPANAIHRAGIDPKDVEFVILTHLHWDHAGNCDLFPAARILVQRTEMRYAAAPGRFFEKSFLSAPGGWGHAPYLVPNIEPLDGATAIAPGLSVLPVPGHTPGSQAIVATTEHGVFCISGDAVCTYENVERDLPPGFHVDVDDSMESMDRMRAVADNLLPSHDYAVLSDGYTTEIGAAHLERGQLASRSASVRLRSPRDHR
jgi:N-acyl homoserine lactone hydrolase